MEALNSSFEFQNCKGNTQFFMPNILLRILGFTCSKPQYSAVSDAKIKLCEQLFEVAVVGKLLHSYSASSGSYRFWIAVEIKTLKNLKHRNASVKSQSANFQRFRRKVSSIFATSYDPGVGVRVNDNRVWLNGFRTLW